MATYVCPICGYTYDESVGSRDQGIAPGTLWADLPEDWVCPLCGAPKSVFEAQAKVEPTPAAAAPALQLHSEELRELSFGELAALCANLGKGCEKQYRAEEAKLFFELAAYYEGRVEIAKAVDFSALRSLVQADLNSAFPAAREVAAAQQDRGTLRALTWGEKVSRMLDSLLMKYETQGDEMLDHTNVYVCEICGFVYLGSEPPEVCPVCKVPSLKIQHIAKEAV